MNPIDRYLTALGGAIGGRIPHAERTARLREVRGHLEAAAQEVGLEEATRRFGPVSVVAGDLVRQSRGYSTRSTWALGGLAAVSILAAYLVPSIWTSYFSFSSGGWLRNLMGLFLPPLSLLFFAYRAAQTRRWLVAPALFTLAFVFAAQFPLSIAHFPGLTKDPVQVRHDKVAYWQGEMKPIVEWRAGHIPATVRPAWRHGEFPRFLPLVHLPYRTEKWSHVTLEVSDGPAPTAWAKYGPLWAAYVENQLHQSENDLRDPPRNWFEEVGFDWSGAIRHWSESIVLAALVLVVTNGLVLLASFRYDRRQGNRPEWAR